MSFSITARVAAVFFIFLMVGGTAIAEESAQEKIDRAMSAAPTAISANATIMNGDGTGGPYVMWGETPYAHIMVPVAAD
jgi:hypothetical protein